MQVQTVRLSAEQYEILVKTVPGISVGKDTTDLQAGTRLGVQLVLQKLREGFVIGHST